MVHSSGTEWQLFITTLTIYKYRRWCLSTPDKDFFLALARSCSLLVERVMRTPCSAVMLLIVTELQARQQEDTFPKHKKAWGSIICALSISLQLMYLKSKFSSASRTTEEFQPLLLLIRHHSNNEDFIWLCSKAFLGIGNINCNPLISLNISFSGVLLGWCVIQVPDLWLKILRLWLKPFALNLVRKKNKKQNHSIASLESHFSSQTCVSGLYQRRTGENVFQQHACHSNRERLWFPTSIIPSGAYSGWVSRESMPPHPHPKSPEFHNSIGMLH